jgi:hypothetical protein
MTSENGHTETKVMALEQVRFAKSNASNSVEDVAITALAQPNPMKGYTNIQFTSSIDDTVRLKLYNQIGKLVKVFDVDVNSGTNSVTIERDDMASGIYFCKLDSEKIDYKTLKLIFE